MGAARSGAASLARRSPIGNRLSAPRTVRRELPRIQLDARSQAQAADLNLSAILREGVERALDEEQRVEELPGGLYVVRGVAFIRTQSR